MGVAAWVGAAVRVGAAAKAPSWAPWHSSVEVAEVVRGVGNGKERKTTKTAARCFRGRNTSQGHVHCTGECPPGPRHRGRKETGFRFRFEIESMQKRISGFRQN